MKADQLQHIEHVSGCEGRPRCVDAWADGETRKGGEGNGDARRAAAFIPWKLIPPFVHLSPSDKMGRLWLCSFFFFFSTVLHPSIVIGLSWAGRKEASY